MSEKNVAFTRDRSIPKSYELVLREHPKVCVNLQTDVR